MLKQIDQFLQDTLLNFETQIDWRFAFRGSSLPCCPRQLLLGKFFSGAENFNKIESFTTRYHFHVGRAVHALAQETWAAQGLLWGDWRCLDHERCGIAFYNKRLESGKCIRCGAPAEYIEKEIHDVETGFSGHCDGVLWCPPLNGYVVAELKTRNHNIIKAASEPYVSDLYQVSAYATLLFRKYQLPIMGRLILWIGKPQPQPHKFWFYPGLGESLADEQLRLKRILDEALRSKDFSTVTGICSTPKDVEKKNCPFGGICLSPSCDKLIANEFSEWVSRNLD